MKKLLTMLSLFLLLSFAAYGSDGKSGGSDDVIKPDNITAFPGLAALRVLMEVDFIYEPAESANSCTNMEFSNCGNIIGLPTFESFKFIPQEVGECRIEFTCGGDIYIVLIPVIDP